MPGRNAGVPRRRLALCEADHAGHAPGAAGLGQRRHREHQDLPKHKADYLIKRNLRKESLEDWLEEAQAHGEWEFPREGKEVYTGETWRERDGKLYRVVFEVIYRTIAADGQKLLVPDIEANTWWTSLKLSPKEVIALYHAHGTSEQYHSEIKTDMDLERLPSGKFATNATMLSLGLVAYNVLRLCGQGACRSSDGCRPTSGHRWAKKVFRRRLRSVMQDLMYMAAKLTWHANRWKLAFWQNSPWGATWRRLYARFCGSPVRGEWIECSRNGFGIRSELPPLAEVVCAQASSAGVCRSLWLPTIVLHVRIA